VEWSARQVTIRAQLQIHVLGAHQSASSVPLRPIAPLAYSGMLCRGNNVPKNVETVSERTRRNVMTWMMLEVMAVLVIARLRKGSFVSRVILCQILPLMSAAVIPKWAWLSGLTSGEPSALSLILSFPTTQLMVQKVISLWHFASRSCHRKLLLFLALAMAAIFGLARIKASSLLM
jgi:hypothetical protein